jgi:hypothetical protein
VPEDSLRILFVDDGGVWEKCNLSRNFIERMKALIVERGIPSVSIANARSLNGALVKLEKTPHRDYPFHIIFMDLVLAMDDSDIHPDDRGLPCIDTICSTSELLKHIRDHVVHKPHVVLHSGVFELERDLVARHRAQGFDFVDGAVGKPASAEELVSAVIGLVKNKRLVPLKIRNGLTEPLEEKFDFN